MAHGWTDSEFEKRPLYAYPLPHGRDNIIGNLITYQIQKGDTLLDVGRWFGVTATEISSANGKIDWWTPPVGKNIILPDEYILPDTPHVGIILNIPEMRIYYYYPSPTGPVLGGGKLKKAGFKAAGAAHSGIHPDVVYTFPVGLGRFDWKTPIGSLHRTRQNQGTHLGPARGYLPRASRARRRSRARWFPAAIRIIRLGTIASS